MLTDRGRMATSGADSIVVFCNGAAAARPKAVQSKMKRAEEEGNCIATRVVLKECYLVTQQ